jgi:integrase
MSRQIHRLTQVQCERSMPGEAIVAGMTDGRPVIAVRMAKGEPFFLPGTDKALKGAVPAVRDGKNVLVKRTAKYLNDGMGLLLCVTPSPTDPNGVRRSWCYRWRRGGKLKKIGLGSLLTTDLQRARELADRCRRQLADGLDPLTVKLSQMASQKVAAMQLKTLRTAVDAYLVRHSAGWSRKHAHAFKQQFDHLEPMLDLPVQKLTTDIIVQSLTPIWDQYPDAGRRLRSALERVISFSVSKGWRERGDNPAQWEELRHHFRPRSQLQPVRHYAALDFRSIADFMAKVRATDSIVARGLELMVLTATRTMETGGATGDEFSLDGDNPTWTIPPTRQKTGKKTGKTLIIPLSLQAVRCLRRVEMKPGQRLFPFHDRAIYRLARKLSGMAITSHGTARSAFKDFASETQPFDNIVSEAALGHAVSDKVEAAYRRGDLFQKRRLLMDAWGRACDGVTETAENVVPIAGRRG